KKARRIKHTNSLFDLSDERVSKYDKKELLRILGDNRYHSSKDSNILSPQQKDSKTQRSSMS
ncbi:1015_t:CDS:2, partial [Funneliformis geosporum]